MVPRTLRLTGKPRRSTSTGAKIMHNENPLFTAGFDAPAGRPAPESARGLSDAAIARYTLRLMEVNTALAERQQQALHSYLERATQSAPAALAESDAKEYQELIRVVQSNDADRIAAAHAAYFASLRNLRERIGEDMRAALEDYYHEVRAAWEGAWADSQAAYLEYVQSISEAFAALPADGPDPAALAAIGQSVSTVAAYAGSVMQSLAALDVETRGRTT